MNKVLIVGRLTSDVKPFSDGKGVNFSIAVNRNYKNADGKYDADFPSCVAYRNTAEFIKKYFKKGSMISVVGELRTGSYEKNGQKIYTTNVEVDEARFVGGKDDTAKSEEATTKPEIKTTDDSDDLPFA